MNVSNLENSRKLYELTWWTDTDMRYRVYKRIENENYKPHVRLVYGKSHIDTKTGETCPAYDAGYLLRKLPKSFVSQEHRCTIYLTLEWLGDEKWAASYQLDTDSISYEQKEDTPEDALALLAIKLFEEGVLNAN